MDNFAYRRMAYREEKMNFCRTKSQLKKSGNWQMNRMLEEDIRIFVFLSMWYIGVDVSTLPPQSKVIVSAWIQSCHRHRSSKASNINKANAQCYALHPTKFPRYHRVITSSQQPKALVRIDKSSCAVAGQFNWFAAHTKYYCNFIQRFEESAYF